MTNKEYVYAHQEKPSEAMIWHMERLQNAFCTKDWTKMAKIFNEALRQFVHEEEMVYKLKKENG